MEEELLKKCALCLDPYKPNTSEIVERMLRSFDSAQGKDDRDKKAREKNRDGILEQVKIYQDISDINIFPGFEPLSSIQYEDYKTLEISEELLKNISEKLIRGITYIDTGFYIEDSHTIDSKVKLDPKTFLYWVPIIRNGKTLEKSPVMLVKKVVDKSDHVSGMYYIEIWEKLKLYVYVYPKKDKNLTTQIPYTFF